MNDFMKLSLLSVIDKYKLLSVLRITELNNVNTFTQ